MSSFWSFGVFGAKSLVFTKPFPHENFQLFFVVLVENRQTHFGDMSSFVQDLTRSGCTKVTWGDSTFVLRKFLDLQSTKVTCPLI